MPLSQITQELHYLLKDQNLLDNDLSKVKNFVNQQADLRVRNKNGDNAFTLAIKSNKLNILNYFRELDLNYFNSQVRIMQSRWIIGKEKDGIFTASEIDRTQMDQNEKKLDVTFSKTEGLEIGKIMSQSVAKREGKEPTSYLLKKADFFSLQHLREILGARFYAYFAGEEGTIMAKTRLVTLKEEEILEEESVAAEKQNFLEDDSFSDDSLVFRNIDGEDNVRINLGSRILSFTQYESNKPYISENGKISINIDGIEQEIQGYLSSMIVAKFIQDFDCDGFGYNDGYTVTSLGIQNVKIDPGRAFGFMDDINIDITDISEGITINLTYKMIDDVEYRTFIPLEYIDLNNCPQLRPELKLISALLRQYYPEFDSRDPVLGSITYAEIIQHPKLYHELAKTINEIVNCSEENLTHLVTYNIPPIINHLKLEEDQETIIFRLKLRQQAMARVYSKEIQYMESYNNFKGDDNLSDFETILERMRLSNIKQQQTHYEPIDSNLLIGRAELRHEVFEISKKLRYTAKYAEKDSEYESINAQNVENTIKILEKFSSIHSTANSFVQNLQSKIYTSSFAEKIRNEVKNSASIDF